MKRDQNLHPLSWDHHAALTAAVLVRRQLESKPDYDTLARTAAQFVTFHAEALLPHFRHEEETLLPAFLNHAAEDDPMVLRLLRDHVAIHALIRRLAAAPPEAPALTFALTELIDRLEAHVRFEEREMFPRIESTLTETELTALGAVFHAHPAPAVVIPGGDGRPVCPGPQTGTGAADEA